MSVVHVVTNLETEAPRRASRTFQRRRRLSTLARRSDLNPRREVVIAQRNGRWVYQKDWHQTLCGDHDVVTFCVMPRGGDALRTVASIGIMIVAAIAAPYLAGALGFAAGTLGFTAATVAITGGLAPAGGYAIDVPMLRRT